MKKIEDIEILRAVAIVFTLIQHLGSLFAPSKEAWALINLNNPYWGGVDLFFCISGFVISKRMFETWQNKSRTERWIEIKNFWVRRFFRIIPTLWLWVGLSLMGSLYFNSSGSFGPALPNLMDALAAVLNYANVHVFLCVIGQSLCGPNPVYWSLSLEEQFYFILPLLFFTPRKFIIFLAILLVAIQLPIQRLPWDQTVGGALWFIRTDAILLGVLLAYFSTMEAYKTVSSKMQSHRALSNVAFIMLIILLSALPRSGFYFAAGGIALTSASLVLLASFNKNLLLARSLPSQPLLWIGSRSFSLYLLHMPLYYFMNEIVYRASGFDEKYVSYIAHNPVFGFATLTLLLLSAELNYRLIETPLRNLGVRINNRKPGVQPAIG